MLSTATTSTHMNRDRLRQILNIVLAPAPTLVAILGYLLGTNTKFTATNASTPQIVPIDYAFIVWAVIYGGAVVYAIYQLLPQHRQDVLLRSIGFYTAFAYLCTALWIIAAQFGADWLTVILFFCILASLVAALNQCIRLHGVLTRAERLLVVFPLGVFLGWTTVATIANVATALAGSGFSNVLLSNQNWTIVMLSIGGLIASFVTFRSRGNIGYTLTVIWALMGIAIANVVRTPSTPVVIAASIVSAVVALVLVGTLILNHSRRAA